MASDFQILGYTEMVGFLEGNFMKRWQEVYVFFVSLVFSVCSMPSAFILLSPILSRMHTHGSRSFIFINDNEAFTITSSYSM